jgi:ribosomal-protein-alanine N-acetyltransferase
MGIGRKLISALEERLAAMGAETIRLEAAEENPMAIALYRKSGYHARERVRNYYGRGKHALRMHKSLGQEKRELAD